MTVPAGLSLAFLSHHVVNLTGLHHLGVQLCMTTDTVVHDNLCTLFLSLRSLSLAMGEEHCYVLHAVCALEEILAGDVLVRHMTVVASSIATMGRVLPCSVIGRHDMAVHASRWVISNVRMDAKQVQKQTAKAYDETTAYYEYQLLSVG